MPKQRKNKGRIVPEVPFVLPGELKAAIYEGESLDALLGKLQRVVESSIITKGALPEKIWMKQQFCIGVNDVTRVLERMPIAKGGTASQEPPAISESHKATPVVLQAVLLASDCRPNLLTKHLPSLASTRRVPLISIRDGRHGSLRLGELMKIQTALAIGVKVTGSGINRAIEEILNDGGIVSRHVESSEISCA